ncbi:hypothetical protein ACFY19_01050 [Streptosporangium saharense]|uniref:hypothetical protein n=1 Tax=Streptosporangium saharense TaxID=1706840 RepID=UPI003690139F
MTDRTGNDQDRLVHGGPAERTDVPSQRAEEATPAFREPQTPEDHREPLDDQTLVGHRNPLADRAYDESDRAYDDRDVPDPAHPADLSSEGDLPTADVRATPADAPANEGLFDQDPDEVRRRWQEVQASFVDDPRDSVERADSLVTEVGDQLRAALEARASGLRDRWQDAEGGDTEGLRTALRDYRALLDRLLDLTSGSATGLPTERR